MELRSLHLPHIHVICTKHVQCVRYYSYVHESISPIESTTHMVCLCMYMHSILYEYLMCICKCGCVYGILWSMKREKSEPKKSRLYLKSAVLVRVFCVAEYSSDVEKWKMNFFHFFFNFGNGKYTKTVEKPVIHTWNI